MSANYFGYFIIALVIGLGGPIQTGINGSLARLLGHPLLAAVTNTSLATLAITTVLMFLRVPLPNSRTIAEAPWWAWCGGLIGAFAVFGALNFAPKMGAAAFVSVAILGTMTASLLVDHFGLLSFNPHALTPTKLFGAVLVVAGMTIIQFER